MAKTAHHSAPLDDHNDLLGIGAMLVAMASIVANDVFVKLVSKDLPLGEIIAIRGAMATLVIAIIAHFRDQLIPGISVRSPYVGLRLVGEIGATILFLSALIHMPIGVVSAIMQFVPLAVIAGAALFLSESVGWRRWLATLMGLFGVMLIVWPVDGQFDAWALLALGAVIFVAMRDLATRRIDTSIPTLFLTTLTAAGVTLLGVAMLVFEAWQMPSVVQLVMLFAAALLLLCSYFTIIVAMRIGEVAVVAPFRYSVVFWALIAGFLVWGDKPDRLALLGMVIVISAGLYTFKRERTLV